MQQLELISERLRLRLIHEEDVKAIHELHSMPETDQFNTLGIPQSIEETAKIVQEWVKQNKAHDIRQYTFVIELKTDSTFIGLLGFSTDPIKYKRAEVWFKTIVSQWGKGYTTEALSRIINFGFSELQLHRIQAGCAVGNIASIKVLEKVGMTREGRGRQVLPLKSGWSDNYEYAILETDPRSF